MNFKQWDIVTLKQATALSLSLATVYRSPSGQSYVKHALNWWQTSPQSLQTVWGLRPEKLDLVSPAVFVVDCVLNTPTHKGYLLLLAGETLKGHPEIDPTLIEGTRHEESRLRRLLPHLLQIKREKSQGVFAFVPFHRAEALHLLIASDGRQDDRAQLWQAHYDTWFDWDVTLYSKQIAELIIQTKLVRDRHCHLDTQGLQIDIARPHVPLLLNFGAVRDTLTQIRVYPRLPHNKMESPEINGNLNFDDAVIWTSFDAGRTALDVDVNSAEKYLSLVLKFK